VRSRPLPRLCVSTRSVHPIGTQPQRWKQLLLPSLTIAIRVPSGGKEADDCAVNLGWLATPNTEDRGGSCLDRQKDKRRCPVHWPRADHSDSNRVSPRVASNLTPKDAKTQWSSRSTARILLNTCCEPSFTAEPRFEWSKRSNMPPIGTPLGRPPCLLRDLLFAPGAGTNLGRCL
jgi:hypothetical protein